MSEILKHHVEFEQIEHREVEQTFTPLFPERFDELRTRAMPMEQFYLSHPSESFHLRFREKLKDGQLHYSAALKDCGELTENGLSRLEVEVPVSAELYQFYKSEDLPILRKLRATPMEHIAVDFYEDGKALVESEHPEAWAKFRDEYGDVFVEVSGDRLSSNEQLAHIEYRRQHDGSEACTPEAELDCEQMTREIMEKCYQNGAAMVQISGRSGSGKSTIVREIKERLAACGASSTCISTDDYHRGGTWLRRYNHGNEWTEWDHPIVYDTAQMAEDIARLKSGETIARRIINFTDVEPQLVGDIEPVHVIIIEGIYAASPDFSHFDTLRYDMPTPLATCIGRRLLRDLKERPQFADPKKSLVYMLEQAEPMYMAQEASRGTSHEV